MDLCLTEAWCRYCDTLIFRSEERIESGDTVSAGPWRSAGSWPDPSAQDEYRCPSCGADYFIRLVHPS